MVVDKDKGLCFSAEEYEVISNFSNLLADILWECGSPVKGFKLASERRGPVFTEEEIIKLCQKLDILSSEYVFVEEVERMEGEQE